jgi:HAD superfamily hydrolase (TIGR01509 family)
MTKAAAVSAILFDAGNTLVRIDANELAEIFRVVGGETDPRRIREQELQARRVLHDAVTDGQVGTEPGVWHAYFVTLFEACGVPVGSREHAGRELRNRHREHHLWTQVEDGAHEVLEALQRDGYRLGVISNADGRIQSLLERVGLLPHFEFVIDSGNLGVEKPDPAIFREGCRRLDLPPNECLYVGDLYPVDYLGAREAGLQAVLLDPLVLYGGRATTIATLTDLPDLLTRDGPEEKGSEFSAFGDRA